MLLEKASLIIVFALVMLSLGWFGTRLFVRRGRAELRREARRLSDISSLSISEASALALPKLSDRSLFIVSDAHNRPDGELEPLSFELRRVFLRFETIKAKNPARTTISRVEIGRSTTSRSYLRIGTVGTDTDLEGEIVVRPGEEAIYELYPGEQPDPEFGTYRSVYHWILAVSEEATKPDLK
jgi:hypothetical protein